MKPASIGPLGPAMEEGANSLFLRLVHVRGQPRRAVLRVPSGGIGAAAALELDGMRRNDANWRAANRCRIVWRSEPGEWLLVNDSATVVCAIDDCRIGRGASAPLRDAGVLELGLSRFVVERTGMAGAEAATEPERRGPVPQGHSPSRDDVADPFGVPGMVGTRRLPPADVVTSLLHEGPRLPRVVEFAPGGGIRSSPFARPAECSDLFGQWHEEFERAVRDPRSLVGHAEWQPLPAPGGASAPTLAQLSTQGAAFPSLLDILRANDGIDGVIDGFDRLDGPDLLAFPPPVDVLVAFAPELARHAIVELPGLTRREHHDIAIDSHVRIGARVGDGEAAA